MSDGWLDETCAALGGVRGPVDDEIVCKTNATISSYADKCHGAGGQMHGDKCSMRARSRRIGGQVRHGCAHPHFALDGDTCTQTTDQLCRAQGGQYQVTRLNDRVVGVCHFDPIVMTGETFEEDCAATGGRLKDGYCVRPIHMTPEQLAAVDRCATNPGGDECHAVGQDACFGNVSDGGRTCTTAMYDEVIGRCGARGYQRAVRENDYFQVSGGDRRFLVSSPDPPAAAVIWSANERDRVAAGVKSGLPSAAEQLHEVVVCPPPPSQILY